MPVTLKYIYDIRDQFSKKIGMMIKNIKRLGRTHSTVISSINNNLSTMHQRTGSIISSLFNVKNAIIAIGAAWAGSKIFSFPITKAAFLEDQIAAFKVQLGGSEEAAKKLVDRLNVMGAKTPFEFPELANTTNLLMGMGAATEENVIDKLKMLGDVSQGNAEYLNRIAVAYGRIQSTGKATAELTNMFIDANVPLKELAGSLNLTVAQYYQLQSRGMITAAMIDKAFAKMTGKGGKFYNMMVEKSKTFNGLLSTTNDVIGLVAQKIGNTMLPKAKDILKVIISYAEKVESWVNANQKIINSKIDEYFVKIHDAAKWAKQNIDLLIMAAKILAGALMIVVGANVALKAAMLINNAILAIQKGIVLGINIVWGAYSIALGIATVATNGNIFALKGNIVAIKAARIAVIAMAGAAKIWTGAQWLLNIALTANPIGFVIAGVSSLIGLFALAYYKTRSLTESFKFMGGVIFKALIFPINLIISSIETLLQVFSLIPGSVGTSLGEAAKSVAKFQDKMNLTLTGNASVTPVGMIYDMIKSERSSAGDTIGTTAMAGAVQRERQQNLNIKNTIGGNIKVSAEKGTSVVSSNFSMDTGDNFSYGY